MLSRLSYVALLSAILACQSGCCCPGRAPWPCGRMWYGPSCGECFWHEWFSHPPECCDPCDDCGCYIGPKWQYRNRHDGMGPTQGGDMEGSYAPEPALAPSREAAPPNEPGPAPAEELPIGPTAGTFYNEFGQNVSYLDTPGSHFVEPIYPYERPPAAKPPRGAARKQSRGPARGQGGFVDPRTGRPMR